MDTASVIAEKIQSGAVPPDIDTITALAAQQSSGTEQSENRAEPALSLWHVVTAFLTFVALLLDAWGEPPDATPPPPGNSPG